MLSCHIAVANMFEFAYVTTSWKYVTPQIGKLKELLKEIRSGVSGLDLALIR